MAATMVRGTVKRLLRQEGYGFICHTLTGEDYFFHRSALERADDWAEMEQDCPVEFSVQESPKGLRAMNVRLLD